MAEPDNCTQTWIIKLSACSHWCLDPCTAAAHSHCHYSHELGCHRHTLHHSHFHQHPRDKGNNYTIIGLYRGYVGIMEKKMETTIMGFIGTILRVLGWFRNLGFGVSKAPNAENNCAKTVYNNNLQKTRPSSTGSHLNFCPTNRCIAGAWRTSPLSTPLPPLSKLMAPPTPSERQFLKSEHRAFLNGVFLM